MFKCKSFGLGYVALCLAACGTASQSPTSPWTADSPTPLTASVQQALSGFLRTKGVVFLNQGERVALAIPADTLFTPGTTDFTEDAPALLDGVSLYIRNALSHLPAGTPIKIMGFTDQIRTTKVQKRQAQAYADNVGSYLWAHGIKAHQLHLHGYGSANPIADNHTPAGAAFNRRVVIMVGP